jgi:hypothetical protein
MARTFKTPRVLMKQVPRKGKRVPKIRLEKKATPKITMHVKKPAAPPVKKAVARKEAPAKKRETAADIVIGIEGNLNDCCMFCNNRLVLQAVMNNDVTAVKKLLNDYDYITNPYQSFSFTNTEFNALQHACNVTKNKEIMKLFIKTLTSSKQRKALESTLLSKFDSGDQGHYNFNVHIKEIHQARVCF